MKKKLTENSFDVLKTQLRVLSEDQQRAAVGGGYFEDYGIGYYDLEGNYHWTRSREDTSGSYGSTYNNFWDSTNSGGLSGTGMYEDDSVNGYGKRDNPITKEDYNFLARNGNWYGGYVEDLGYVGLYATSVDYGNSIYNGSWVRYGDAGYPVSQSDFFQLWNDGKWNGGYVSGFNYVSREATEIPIISSPNAGSGVAPVQSNGVNIVVNRLQYEDKTTLSSYTAYAYDESGNIISTVEGVFLERGFDYEQSTVNGSKTAILPGTYNVEKSSLHGVPGYYEVTGVEGRSGIIIHTGNSYKDSEGCLLTGESGYWDPSTKEYKVSGSNNKLRDLNDLLNTYGDNGITINITI